MRQSIVADRITAREICVEDAEGNPRITLTSGSDGASIIHIMNSEGQMRFGIEVRDDGVMMALLSENNVQRLHIQTSETATGVSLRDSDGIERANLTTDQDPGLMLFDPDGRLKLMIALKDALPEILVRDHKGTVHIYPPDSKEG